MLPHDSINVQVTLNSNSDGFYSDSLKIFSGGEYISAPLRSLIIPKISATHSSEVDSGAYFLNNVSVQTNPSSQIIGSPVFLSGKSDGYLNTVFNSATKTFSYNRRAIINDNLHISLPVEIDSQGIAKNFYPAVSHELDKGYGSGNFSVNSLLTLNARHTVLLTADLNNDGNLDIIVYNSVTQNIEIYLQTQPLLFILKSTIHTTSPNVVIKIDDYDHDGYLDIICDNISSYSIVVYKNDGHGNFSQAITIPLTHVTYDFALVDLNFDSYDDIVVPNYELGDIEIYLNNGGQSFSFYSRIAVGANPFKIVAYDIDSDGDKDRL